MNDPSDMQPLTIEEVRQRGTLTVDEGAAFLGMGAHQCREACKSGEIPAFRIGRRIFVKAPELLKMLGDDPPDNGPEVDPPEHDDDPALPREAAKVINMEDDNRDRS